MAGKTTKATAPKRKTTSRPTKGSTKKKSTRPIFSVATLVTLGIFAALIVALIYMNNKKEVEEAEATPENETSYVFTDADGIISGIKVEPVDGNVTELTRNKENVWELTQPEKTEANQTMAEAAATQLSAINIVDEISGDEADFGLENPMFVITVTFADGKIHTLEVGDSAITNNGYYVQLDNGKIMLASLNGIDALTQLAFFPPYLNTPTPTVTPLPPTETPAPASETPASTPAEVTVTPTP